MRCVFEIGLVLCDHTEEDLKKQSWYFSRKRNESAPTLGCAGVLDVMGGKNRKQMWQRTLSSINSSLLSQTYQGKSGLPRTHRLPNASGWLCVPGCLFYSTLNAVIVCRHLRPSLAACCSCLTEVSVYAGCVCSVLCLRRLPAAALP